MKTNLFIIEQANRADGERYFWERSTEHGTGWHPHYPKQAFSKSQLSKEIFDLIDKGYFTDLIIRELLARGDTQYGEEK